jgi:hypothetical protein
MYIDEWIIMVNGVKWFTEGKATCIFEAQNTFLSLGFPKTREMTF